MNYPYMRVFYFLAFIFFYNKCFAIDEGSYYKNRSGDLEVSYRAEKDVEWFFYCREDGRIPVKLRCNGEGDCSDGSDEEGCINSVKNINGSSLASKFYLCDDQELLSNILPERMINYWQVCDMKEDCDGGDDEVDCFNDVTTKEYSFSDFKIVPVKARNVIKEVKCNENELLVKDRGCVFFMDRCLLREGSVNNTYKRLSGCERFYNESSDSNQADMALLEQDFDRWLDSVMFKCNEFYYIHASKVCDLQGDCPNRMDEYDCKYIRSYSHIENEQSGGWSSITTTMMVVSGSVLSLGFSIIPSMVKFGPFQTLKVIKSHRSSYTELGVALFWVGSLVYVLDSFGLVESGYKIGSFLFLMGCNLFWLDARGVWFIFHDYSTSPNPDTEGVGAGTRLTATDETNL